MGRTTSFCADGQGRLAYFILRRWAGPGLREGQQRGYPGVSSLGVEDLLQRLTTGWPKGDSFSQSEHTEVGGQTIRPELGLALVRAGGPG